MCGIAGFVSSANQRFDRHTLPLMTEALRHRGPDDQGHWYAEDAGVGLGHRRLSIVDLSEAGHQPMLSASGRYAIVYNGEIYNHMELRTTLEAQGARSWRGHSDTETLLAAIEAWGIRSTFEHSVGMFAAAIWDRQERKLSLVRDRLGEKPLYYGWHGDGFIFASELKALRAVPGFAPGIDQDALGLYMIFNYVPAPRSIYRGVRKLMPGSILTLHPDNGEAREERYWTLRDAMQVPGFTGSAEQAAEELERLLARAVSLQQISDVPLGCFLSGGIDSSTIAALMQAQSPQPIRTFAIGFREEAFNEAHHAEQVARHLGTAHTSLYIGAEDALALVPKVPDIWDEPFADSSQLPTALVAQLARRDVTVCLSGDGGDELFAGYPRYERMAAVEKFPAKRLVASLLGGLPLDLIARLCAGLPGLKGVTTDRLENLRAILAAAGPEARYLTRAARWKIPADIVAGATIDAPHSTDFRAPRGTDGVNIVSALDAVTYLPDDILVKVDRAAMATSLETRVPLLDHRVVEFAFSLPGTIKLHNGQTKWPLRQILSRHVPCTLTDRPKQGFGVPIGAWLRGPLREWAQDLLSPAQLKRAGLEPAPVRNLWEAHLASTTPITGLETPIWSALMYQAWFVRHA